MRYLTICAALLLPQSVAAQDRPVAPFDWFAIHADDPAAGPLDRVENFDGSTASSAGLLPAGTDADWWSVDAGKLVIAAGRDPLWSDADPTVLGVPLSHRNYSVTTLIDFSGLGEGDVGGLVARADRDHWVSIQVERIEPADLIAVRLRQDETSQPAGKLIQTTAIPGSYQGRVKLRIDRRGDNLSLMFADENGLWQILAEDIGASFLHPDGGDQPPVRVGPFATDGAD